MLSRDTGKTLPIAYVELPLHWTKVALQKKGILKSRIVQVTSSSQSELLNAVFPKASAQWQGINVLGEKVQFITREEINFILLVCKNYKVRLVLKRRFILVNVLIDPLKILFP